MNMHHNIIIESVQQFRLSPSLDTLFILALAKTFRGIVKVLSLHRWDELVILTGFRNA